MMNRLMLCTPVLFAGLTLGGHAKAANNIPLTMMLTVDQSTCDVSLLTPSTITFPAVSLSTVNAPSSDGSILLAGTQNVTVGLTNCEGSAKDGATPAIQVTGTTPVAENPNLFREYTSTATGNVGFGIRYQPDLGPLQDYLKSGDLIDVGSAGVDVVPHNLNFVVNMLHGPTGDQVSAGTITARISFQFVYH